MIVLVNSMKCMINMADAIIKWRINGDVNEPIQSKPEITKRLVQSQITVYQNQRARRSKSHTRVIAYE